MLQFPSPVDRVQLGLFDAGENPVSYGADPMGKFDSTSAIQAALNVAGASPIPGSVLLRGKFLTGTLVIPDGVTVNAYGAIIQQNGSGTILSFPTSVYDNPPTFWMGGLIQCGGNNSSLVRLSSTGSAQGNIYLRDMVIDGMSFTGTVGLNVQDNATGNTYENLEIRNCATGITNGTNHTYSSLFRRCFVHANGTGIAWGGFGQNTIFRDCLINSNTAAQCIVGAAGTAAAGPVAFEGCEFEFGRAVGNLSNIQILNGVMVTIHGCYFESNTATSFDVIVSNSSQAANHVQIENCYFQGNSNTTTSVQVSAGVSTTILTVKGSHFLGYTNAIVDSGTSSSVRRIANNELGSYVNDTFNGTALVYP